MLGTIFNYLKVIWCYFEDQKVPIDKGSEKLFFTGFTFEIFVKLHSSPSSIFLSLFPCSMQTGVVNTACVIAHRSLRRLHHWVNNSLRQDELHNYVPYMGRDKLEECQLVTGVLYPQSSSA